MIKLENDLFKTITLKPPEGSSSTTPRIIVKIDERPLVLINHGGFKRGQIGDLELRLDTGKGLITLDRLYHRAHGYYDWSHYMRGMNINRWQVDDYLASVGFHKRTLQEASEGRVEQQVGGRASLCAGIVVYYDLYREMILYVNDCRKMEPTPMGISTRYIADVYPSLVTKETKMLHWTHSGVGSAWIRPLLCNEGTRLKVLGEPALVGLEETHAILKKLGFEPLAADLAFADRIET